MCANTALKNPEGLSLHTAPVYFVGHMRHTLLQRTLRHIPAHNDLSAPEKGCPVGAGHDRAERGRTEGGRTKGAGRRGQDEEGQVGAGHGRAERGRTERGRTERGRTEGEGKKEEICYERSGKKSKFAGRKRKPETKRRRTGKKGRITGKEKATQKTSRI